MSANAVGCAYDAVLFLGFGGPTKESEIRPFLDHVLLGRPVPASRYESVVEHYLLLGARSPYNELTERQASALGDVLRDRLPSMPIYIGYRHVPPFIEDVVAEIAQRKMKNVFAVILAPHQSAASWDKYIEPVQEACERLGDAAPDVTYIAPFFDHPLFIRAHAARIREAQRRFDEKQAPAVHVVFTAHSIPLATPGRAMYVDQLERSMALIAREAKLERWSLAYQSRSGSPSEPWLEPDVRDEIDALRQRGVRDLILTPIGFLIDHVEVLYDLDVEAAGFARDLGLHLERAPAINDHPFFIEMIAENIACA